MIAFSIQSGEFVGMETSHALSDRFRGGDEDTTVEARVRFVFTESVSTLTAFRFLTPTPCNMDPVFGMLTSGTATAPEGIRCLIDDGEVSDGA